MSNPYMDTLDNYYLSIYMKPRDPMNIGSGNKNLPSCYGGKTSVSPGQYIDPQQKDAHKAANKAAQQSSQDRRKSS
jgi:hypothetical protein